MPPSKKIDNSSLQGTSLIDLYADCTDAYISFYSMVSSNSYFDENDGETDYDKTARKSVSFYAFVSDFSDTFNSSWESKQYFGKQDPFVGYKNTKRTLTLNWYAPAETLEQAIENMKRINGLVSFLYPAYYLDESSVSAGDSTALTPFASPSDRDLDDRSLHEGSNYETATKWLKTQHDDTRWYWQGLHWAQSLPLARPPYIKLQWSNVIKHRTDITGTARKINMPGGPKGPKSLGLNDPMPSKEIFADSRDALYGYIENLSFNPVTEAGYFSSLEDQSTGENPRSPIGSLAAPGATPITTTTKKLYPKVWSLSCNFTVLHQHALGRGEPIW